MAVRNEQVIELLYLYHYANLAGVFLHNKHFMRVHMHNTFY